MKLKLYVIKPLLAVKQQPIKILRIPEDLEQILPNDTGRENRSHRRLLWQW